MIYDPATYSPGNMTYSVGTTAGYDTYLGRIIGGLYTFTQESGDLTFATAGQPGRSFMIGHDGAGAYVLNGGKVTFDTGNGLILNSYEGPGTFDQNGGEVVVTDPDGAGLWIGRRDDSGGDPALYSLGGGTVKCEMLSIGTDTNTTVTPGNNAAGTLDFTAGSTGTLYVSTSDRSASDIAALITAGDITLGGASASPSDFAISELTSGPYAGYTEVKLPAGPEGEIPEPCTLAMLGLAFAGLGGYARKRRRS